MLGRLVPGEGVHMLPPYTPEFRPGAVRLARDRGQSLRYREGHRRLALFTPKVDPPGTHRRWTNRRPHHRGTVGAPPSPPRGPHHHAMELDLLKRPPVPDRIQALFLQRSLTTPTFRPSLALIHRQTPRSGVDQVASCSLRSNVLPSLRLPERSSNGP